MTDHIANIADTILVCADPTGTREWFPAIVESASDNGQLTATCFMAGNTVFVEGARHIDNAWWLDSTSKKIAIEEGIYVWKESDYDRPPEKIQRKPKILKEQLLAQQV